MIQQLLVLLMVLVLLGASRQPLLGSVQQASRSLVAALLGGPSGRWQQTPRPVSLAAPYGETPARVQLAFAPNPQPSIETAPRNPPSATPPIEPEGPAGPPRLKLKGRGPFFFLPPMPENGLEELVPGQELGESPLEKDLRRYDVWRHFENGWDSTVRFFHQWWDPEENPVPPRIAPHEEQPPPDRKEETAPQPAQPGSPKDLPNPLPPPTPPPTNPNPETAPAPVIPSEPSEAPGPEPTTMGGGDEDDPPEPPPTETETEGPADGEKTAAPTDGHANDNVQPKPWYERWLDSMLRRKTENEPAVSDEPTPTTAVPLPVPDWRPPVRFHDEKVVPLGKPSDSSEAANDNLTPAEQAARAKQVLAEMEARARSQIAQMLEEAETDPRQHEARRRLTERGQEIPFGLIQRKRALDELLQELDAVREALLKSGDTQSVEELEIAALQVKLIRDWELKRGVGGNAPDAYDISPAAYDVVAEDIANAARARLERVHR